MEDFSTVRDYRITQRDDVLDALRNRGPLDEIFDLLRSWRALRGAEIVGCPQVEGTCPDRTPARQP